MKKKLLFLSALCLLTGCAGETVGPPTGILYTQTPTEPATLPITAAEVEPAENEFLFRLDLSQRETIISNKVSDMNVWMFQSSCLNGWDEGYFRENLPFVERIQFMQATGGSAERDLFLDPYDASEHGDYKFGELIAACRNVLAQGVKPMIKTGNVPLKLSSVNTPGVFGVNLYPPDDYSEYYEYIRAVAAALAVTVEPKITAAAAATAAVFFQTEWNCNVFPSVLPSLRFRTNFLLPDHYTGRPPIFQQFQQIATTSLQLFRGPDKYIKFLLPV